MEKQATADGIFRVTVKGRFVDLSERAYRQLVDASPEHSRFQSAYTTEGTLVYDDAIKFFSLRYEVRIGGDTPSQSAAAIARSEADRFLQTMGYGHSELEVSVVDLSTMWSD